MNQHVRDDGVFNWPILTQKQELFVQAGITHRPDAKYIEFCGGWGAAKTWALCMRAILQGTNTDVFGNLCGNRIILGRWTAKELKDTTLKDFLQLLPNKWLRGNGRGVNRQDMTLTIPGGTEYVLAHFENFTIGGNYSAVFIDQSEEVPEDIFDILPGRTRMMQTIHGVNIPDWARCICTTRNPNGHSWQYRRWEMNRLREERGDPYDNRYYSIPTTTHDNAQNLPDSYITDLEKNLSPKKYRIFVGGSHEAFEGQIYDEWEYDRCVNEYDVLPSSTWPKFVGIDHGYPAAKVASFLALTPWKDILCYDEVVMEDAKLSEFVGSVLARMERHQIDYAEAEGWEPRGLEEIHMWIHDPSMNRRTDSAGSTNGSAALTVASSYVQEFRRQTSGSYTPAFYPSDGGPGTLDAGNDKVNWLFWNNDPSRHHLPKERVNPCCEKHTESFETYHYDQRTGRPVQETGGYYVDVCDAHRYPISFIFRGDFTIQPKSKRIRTHVDDVLDQMKNIEDGKDLNAFANESGWVMR
jgi:hypothetical protein